MSNYTKTTDFEAKDDERSEREGRKQTEDKEAKKKQKQRQGER